MERTGSFIGPSGKENNASAETPPGRPQVEALGGWSSRLRPEGIPLRRVRSSSRILAQIPGKYVVEAMSRLPECTPEAGSLQLEIDAGLFGRFRVTYRPYHHSRQAWQHGWFWIAEAAERLDSAC